MRTERGPGPTCCIISPIRKQEIQGGSVPLTTDHLPTITTSPSFGLSSSDRSKRIWDSGADERGPIRRFPPPGSSVWTRVELFIMNPSWTSAHVQPGLIKPPRRAPETRPLVSIQISLVMAAVLAEPTGSVLVAAPPAHPAAATSPQLLVVHCHGNLRLLGPWDDDPFGPISSVVEQLWCGPGSQRTWFWSRGGVDRQHQSFFLARTG